jgi:hypothetical protein
MFLIFQNGEIFTTKNGHVFFLFAQKDANRRWAAQQANGGGGGGDGRSGSNGTATGGNGSGPGSVPSSSGMHGIMFGRAGTLDSDSGASNNDAESPIYSQSKKEILNKIPDGVK